jgi:hypothetical protein
MAEGKAASSSLLARTAASVVTAIRKKIAVILALLGAGGISSLLAEYLRGKAVDWIASHFGVFGHWLRDNPASFFTLGVGTAVLCVGGASLYESHRRPGVSSLLTEDQRPYLAALPLSRKWAWGICAVALITVAVIAYGATRYHLKTIANHESGTNGTPTPAKQDAALTRAQSAVAQPTQQKAKLEKIVATSKPPKPKRDTQARTFEQKAARGANTPPAVNCEDGRIEPTVNDCGVSNLEIRGNRFVGAGAAPDLSNTHRALMDGNILENVPANLKISGEDTTFTNNTVRGMNVEVTEKARRTFIDNNLFQSESLVGRIVQYRTNTTERDALLHGIRSAFEAQWKSLPTDRYNANEELLEQFETGVRDQPFDREKAETLLRKVIDATPGQPQ